jgi:hypothetical protein
MPQADFVKLITANLVAAIIAIGAPVLIVWLFLTADPNRDIAAIVAILAALGGGATQYLWQTNTQSAARAQTRNDLLAAPPNGGAPG